MDVSCTACRQCCRQAGFHFLETIEILAIDLCQALCYGLLFSTLNFMENRMKDAPCPPHTLIWRLFLIYFNFIFDTSFPIYRLKDIRNATLQPWPVTCGASHFIRTDWCVVWTYFPPIRSYCMLLAVFAGYTFGFYWYYLQ